MKVFVVYSVFYTYTYIDKVFSSKEKAEEYILSQKEYSKSFHIQQMEVE